MASLKLILLRDMCGYSGMERKNSAFVTVRFPEVHLLEKPVLHAEPATTTVEQPKQ